MKTYMGYLGCCLLFLGAMAQSDPKGKAASMDPVIVSPSYFLANETHHKSGLPLVNQPQVVAVMQTQQGRVLFTVDGAFFNVSESISQAFSDSKIMDPFNVNASSTTKQALPRPTVMSIGFPLLSGQKKRPKPQLQKPLGAKINFLIGGKDQWQTGLSAYETLLYENVWQGVDIAFKTGKNQLRYQIIIKPGADFGAVQFKTGADRVHLQKDGSLKAFLNDAFFQQSKPLAYQVIDGEHHEVAVHYTLKDQGSFGFQISQHHKGEPIVVEPQLLWSTLLGGPGFFTGGITYDVAIDSAGFAYVTGITSLRDFPVTVGSFDPSVYNNYDVFVAKIDTQNSQLIYSTRIGGLERDDGNAIQVTSSGEAVVAGFTGSLNFPKTPGALSETLPGLEAGAFCLKLSSDGSNLLFSTLLGGQSGANAEDLALDSSENIYLTGFTASPDFPTSSNAFIPSPPSEFNAFVTKINPTGSAIIYSTYLGGSGTDAAYHIEVDSQDQAHVFGFTSSEKDFPTTPGVLYPKMLSNQDYYLAKFNQDGSDLVYATFLLASSATGDAALTLDANGFAYVTARTRSQQFQTTPGAFDTQLNGERKAFVAKIGLLGQQLEYATFLGTIDPRDIAIDASGNAVLLGFAEAASDLPTTPQSFDPTYNGGGDVTLTKLNATGSELVFSTFLGGSSTDVAAGIALNANAEVYAVGYSASLDFPQTPDNLFGEMRGYEDHFLTKLSADGTTLVYSTLYGGTGEDGGSALTIDQQNQITVLGYSRMRDFPVTANPFDATHNGGRDLVVSQFDPTGSQLLFSTFIGGSQDETGAAIERGLGGDFFIAGTTESVDFPTLSGTFTGALNGPSDGFLLRLAQDGSTLSWSRLLGGSGADTITDLQIDSQNRIFLAGLTFSADFPTSADAFQQTYGGQGDTFLARFNGSGTTLEVATLLGGSADEDEPVFALTSSEELVVVGSTRSADFPTSGGVFNSQINGAMDAFVAGLSSDLDTLHFSSFLGGSQDDEAKAIAIGSDSMLYVAGNTQSTNFPTTPGAFTETSSGGQDIFVARLDAVAAGILNASFLGGQYTDSVQAMRLDAANAIHLTGSSTSPMFPTTRDAFQEGREFGSLGAVFLTKINDQIDHLLYSTLFGSTRFRSRAEGKDLLLLDDDALVMGTSFHRAVPTTDDAFQPYGNAEDIFLAKLQLCTPLVITSHQGASSQRICPGEPAMLGVTVEGDGPMEYQWFQYDIPIPGANSSTYQLAEVTLADRGVYHCVIKNRCSEVTSLDLIINVSHPVQIAEQPTDEKICLLSNVRFEALPATPPFPFHDSFTYQWFKNGVAIPDGIRYSLTVYDVAPADAATYTCLVSNDCFSTLSQPAELIIIERPIVELKTETPFVCAGGSVTLTTEVTFDGENSFYRWFKNGSQIANASASTLTIQDFDENDATSYSSWAFTSCGAYSSNTIQLFLKEIDGEMAPRTQARGLTLPSFTFNPTCGSTPFTYEWTSQPAVPLITAGNTVIFNAMPTETVQLQCLATSASGETFNATATMLVAESPLFFDFNQDGCNNLQDLFEAAQMWNMPFEDDANGDQRIDILDFMYLDLTGSDTCP